MWTDRGSKYMTKKKKKNGTYHITFTPMQVVKSEIA